eukprot:scaffold9075_cov122-Amphora_coffeaeformis.AAC.1
MIVVTRLVNLFICNVSGLVWYHRAHPFEQILLRSASKKLLVGPKQELYYCRIRFQIWYGTISTSVYHSVSAHVFVLKCGQCCHQTRTPEKVLRIGLA